MSDLRSAEVPPLAPEDHVRGPASGLALIVYTDFECPHCAVLHVRVAPLLADPATAPVRWVLRHFPSRSSHPRAWAAACAAEAAGLQGRFWEMHDALFADQGRLEDPHLWDRARTLGLELERFDADRRSEAVLDRVRRDFQGGVRAGVVTTPTLWSDGVSYAGDALSGRLAGLLAGF